MAMLFKLCLHTLRAGGCLISAASEVIWCPWQCPSASRGIRSVRVERGKKDYLGNNSQIRFGVATWPKPVGRINTPSLDNLLLLDWPIYKNKLNWMLCFIICSCFDYSLNGLIGTQEWMKSRAFMAFPLLFPSASIITLLPGGHPLLLSRAALDKYEVKILW